MSQETTLSGAELIALERRRQIEEEGFSAAHDDEHTDQSLPLFAIHHAAPEGLYIVQRDPNTGRSFAVWPHTWSRQFDKKGKISRVDELTIAGAAIAAEIDRLQRAQAREAQRT